LILIVLVFYCGGEWGWIRMIKIVEQ
jgi:hypothetical protein